MRYFCVFSTYLILTVFNRYASRLLMIRLSFVSPNCPKLYHKRFPKTRRRPVTARKTGLLKQSVELFWLNFCFDLLYNFFIQKLSLLYRPKIVMSIHFLNNFCSFLVSFPQAPWGDQGRPKKSIFDFPSHILLICQHGGGLKKSMPHAKKCA